MSLRTDKTSGTITCVFGIVMVGFALSGLMMIAIQRSLIASMQPMPQFPDGMSADDVLRAIQSVWFIYLPIMIVGGLVYAVAGWYVLRSGSVFARRVAQVNAVCGYLWVVAYSISASRIADIIEPPAIGEPAITASQVLTVAVGTLIGGVFPTGLLYILSRPRESSRGALSSSP